MAIELNIRNQSKNRRRTINPQKKAGAVFLSLISLILIALFGFFYLSQTSTVATKGYEIKQLEKQLETAKESARDLKLEATELQSLKNLQEKVKQLNFVPTEKIQYVAGSATHKDVAKNN